MEVWVLPQPQHRPRIGGSDGQRRRTFAKQIGRKTHRQGQFAHTGRATKQQRLGDTVFACGLHQTTYHVLLAYYFAESILHLSASLDIGFRVQS